MNKNVQTAVKHFWDVRSGGAGVLGGKTLDGFIDLISDVVRNSDLNDVEIHTSKITSQLPGFFRPHKSWDLVVRSKGQLIAAIELKSQVGSIGNNFNNRTEEVLGSGIDLHTAIEESAFGSEAEVFTGYLILVEDSEKSRRNAKITMPYFPVMQGFLADEKERENNYKPNQNGKFPSTKGISYLERYDLLCKRLVLKKLYSAAGLIIANENKADIGSYTHICKQTSIESFLTKLSNHCDLASSYQ
ncbi:PaeR7I family type II restriction endonuclease [Vibrio splendidus]